MRVDYIFTEGSARRISPLRNNYYLSAGHYISLGTLTRPVSPPLLPPTVRVLANPIDFRNLSRGRFSLLSGAGAEVPADPARETPRHYL